MNCDYRTTVTRSAGFPHPALEFCAIKPRVLDKGSSVFDSQEESRRNEESKKQEGTEEEETKTRREERNAEKRSKPK